MKISELEIGRAGEHLIVADLILKGYRAFLTDQGLPFDVVLEKNNKLYKIQVKTTKAPASVPQRVNRTLKYIFHVKRCGKNGLKRYTEGEVDIFALIALDSREIGYIPNNKAKQTMFFLPMGILPICSNEQVKKQIKEFREMGFSYGEIAKKTDKDKSYVARVIKNKENRAFSISYLNDYKIENIL